MCHPKLCSAFDIDTNIFIALLGTIVTGAMFMSSTFNLFTDVVPTALFFTRTMVVETTSLFLTIVFGTKTFTVGAVFAGLGVGECIARVVTDTFNLDTFARWLVTFLQNVTFWRFSERKKIFGENLRKKRSG